MYIHMYTYIHRQVNCQNKTVSSMVTKEAGIRAKPAKFCNSKFKLNQNWCQHFKSHDFTR